MKFFAKKTWSVFPITNTKNVNTYFSSIDQVFQLTGHIISSSIQSEIFVYKIDNKTFFIKRYFSSKRFLSWFGFSRYKVELRNQLWFNRIHVPAANVVAYGEESVLFKTIKGVVILEGIGNAVDLAVLAKQSPERFNNVVWSKNLVLQLASILRKLHSYRFCHNDMHWRNILVQEGETNKDCQTYLIDCPFGKKLFWPFLKYKQLKDLANIDKFAPNHLSRTQRLRFFYEYRQTTKLGQADKKMIYDILKHKTNRLRRKTKSNR